MEETLRYALIGCGRISPNHIGAIKQQEDVELVALCDRMGERAEQLAKRFALGAVPIYTDYLQMLEEVHPALVAIATDSKDHAAIALACMERGIHVIVEKPIALSLEEADAIVKSAAERGVVVCPCHQNRFNKSVIRLKSAVEEGSFGRLFHLTANIRWNRGEDYYRQAPWRGRWDSDGGALMNQCIHNIDLLRWIASEQPLEVFAYTDRLHHPYIQAEDFGVALIKFQHNVYGVIEGTTNIFPQNYEETLCVFGERGTAKIGGKSVNQMEKFQLSGLEDQEEPIKECYSEVPENVYGFGHRPLYRDVIDAIRHRRQPLVDAKAGRDALELVLAIYLSAAEGKPVRLPLHQCASWDFQDRFS